MQNTLHLTAVEPPPPDIVQVELKASRIVHVGKTDAAEYPLAKKKQSYEFLRVSGREAQGRAPSRCSCSGS